MDQNHITVSARGTNVILSLSNSFLKSLLLTFVPGTNDGAVMKTQVIQLYSEHILFHDE